MHTPAVAVGEGQWMDFKVWSPGSGTGMGLSPGSSLEMRSLGPHIGPTESEINDKWVHFIPGNEVATYVM